MDAAESLAANQVSRRVEVGLMTAIVVVAAALRLADLGRVPPAMNQDEVLRGYDAWCLWKTGADYRGVRWPAYLEAYGPGEYVAATSSYLTAPFVGLLGLEPWVVRLPLALAGIATVVLLWLWVRREAGALAGLAAAASLALSPWHVQVSRMAFEGHLTPFFVTAGLAAVTCWAARNHCQASTLDSATQGEAFSRLAKVRMVIGGAALGAAMWTYPAARFVVPVLIVAWAIIEYRAAGSEQRAVLRRQWLLLGCGAVVGEAPMLGTLFASPYKLMARAAHLGLFESALGWREQVSVFLQQYTAHFNPVTLFVTGEGRALQYPDTGFMHAVESIPLVAGAIWLVRARRSTFAKLLIVWWLVYPLPAALTLGGWPQMVRSIMGLPLLSIVVGVGTAWLVQAAGRLARARMVGLAAVSALAISVGVYFRYYFRIYPREAARAFNTELPAAFTLLREMNLQYDAGFLAFPANQAFAYYLFYTRIGPERVQSESTPMVRVGWKAGFEAVLRFDRFWFWDPRVPPPAEHAISYWLKFGLPQGGRAVVVARPGQVQSRHPDFVAVGPDGGDVIEIYQWTERPRVADPTGAQ